MLTKWLFSVTVTPAVFISWHSSNKEEMSFFPSFVSIGVGPGFLFYSVDLIHYYHYLFLYKIILDLASRRASPKLTPVVEKG